MFYDPDRREKMTDWDVAQLVLALAIILVVLWYGTARAEAKDMTMLEEDYNIIAAELPIKHVTQATYDLVLEELELERDMRDSLEHKLFLQTNSNRVLKEELTTVREGLRQMTYKRDYWKLKASDR
ncbi:MAG: hypothetical protein U9Q38_01440 [Thermodesulfobacteriota bacterium]|nr:hypothetical protein [Thermodesulfobacteriota bacterium]